MQGPLHRYHALVTTEEASSHQMCRLCSAVASAYSLTDAAGSSDGDLNREQFDTGHTRIGTAMPDEHWLRDLELRGQSLHVQYVTGSRDSQISE
jgi:hypothetical protein